MTKATGRKQPAKRKQKARPRKTAPRRPVAAKASGTNKSTKPKKKTRTKASGRKQSTKQKQKPRPRKTAPHRPVKAKAHRTNRSAKPKKKPSRTNKSAKPKKKVHLAEADPGRLTPSQLKQLMSLRRSMPGRYASAKDDAARRSREMSRSGRDIGPIPPPAHLGCRRRGLRELRYFLKHYFPHRFALPWSSAHLEIIADVERAAQRGELLATAMWRGGGKTSIIECAALWVMLMGRHKFVAVVASTTHKAIDVLDSIKTELESNALLGEDFPEVCFPVAMLEGINQRARGQLCRGRPTRMVWQARKLVLPTIRRSRASGAILQVAGMKSGEIRGLKHVLRNDDGTTAVIRPTFVIVDDPQTDESARSPAQNAKRESILAGAILGLAGPGEKIAGFALVTIIAPDDMADHLTNRTIHPEWHGKRYRMMNKLPANLKLWDRYASIVQACWRDEKPIDRATEFYRQRREEMDRAAEPAWPAWYNPDEISAVQCAMNIRIRDEAAFWAEYQNEPLVEAEEAALLPAEAIQAKLSHYPRATVPANCEHLTAFVDIHDKLLFWAVCAWADDFTGYVVDYGSWPKQNRPYYTLRNVRRTLLTVVKRGGKEAAILAGLEELAKLVLARRWPRDDGSLMPVNVALIDAGYARETVYEFCRTTRLANVIPAFGRAIGASRRPMVEYTKHRGDRLAAHWYIPAARRGEPVRHVITDVNYWKSFVHARLAVPRGDPGSLTLFGEKPATHRLLAEHLRAERPVQTAGPYGTVDEWRWATDRPDNHFLDCLVGCACAANIAGATAPGTARAVRPRKKRIRLSDIKRRKSQ